MIMISGICVSFVLSFPTEMIHIILCFVVCICASVLVCLPKRGCNKHTHTHRHTYVLALCFTELLTVKGCKEGFILCFSVCGSYDVGSFRSWAGGCEAMTVRQMN